MAISLWETKRQGKRFQGNTRPRVRPMFYCFWSEVGYSLCFIVCHWVRIFYPEKGKGFNSGSSTTSTFWGFPLTVCLSICNRELIYKHILKKISCYHDNHFRHFMFGKYNGFVNKARVSACLYFLVNLLT
jgi:hypothetical protein